jgi:hypothetical protein
MHLAKRSLIYLYFLAAGGGGGNYQPPSGYPPVGGGHDRGGMKKVMSIQDSEIGMNFLILCPFENLDVDRYLQENLNLNPKNCTNFLTHCLTLKSDRELDWPWWFSDQGAHRRQRVPHSNPAEGCYAAGAARPGRHSVRLLTP